MTGTLTAHPVAELFPLMSDADVADLAEDIRRYGLREPIWLHRDGRVIDGRNRLRACQVAEVQPKTQTYADGDHTLVPFVVSLNMKRRHLNESQRSMVAARIANLSNGHTRLGRSAEVTQPEAAHMLNVGERSVRKARTVQELGVPELAAAVERGEVSVSAAEVLAREPDSLQRAAVAAGSVTRVVKEAKQARDVTRRPEAERIDQIRALNEERFTAAQIASRLSIGEQQVKKIAAVAGIELHADKVMGKTRRLDSNRIVEQTVLGVEGVGSLLDRIDFAALDRGQMSGWDEVLTSAIKSLTSLRNNIRREMSYV